MTTKPAPHAVLPLVAALILSAHLSVAGQSPPSRPPTVADIVASADLDGDGVSKPAERFVVGWWLANGGSRLLLRVAATGQTAPYDLSALFRAAASPPSAAAQSPGGTALGATGAVNCENYEFVNGPDLPVPTIVVPDDFATIQGAVNCAYTSTTGADEVIMVRDGTYQESISILTTNLREVPRLLLYAENPGGVTISPPTMPGAPAFTVTQEVPMNANTFDAYPVVQIGLVKSDSIGDVELPNKSDWHGFTITGAGLAQIGANNDLGAIDVRDPSALNIATLTRTHPTVVISGNTITCNPFDANCAPMQGTELGAGVNASQALDIRVVMNEISHNTVGGGGIGNLGNGGGISVVDSWFCLIAKNWIFDNEVDGFTTVDGIGGGIYLERGANPLVVDASRYYVCDNIIRNNRAYTGSGIGVVIDQPTVCFADIPASVEIARNFIRNNTVAQSPPQTQVPLRGGGLAVTIGGYSGSESCELLIHSNEIYENLVDRTSVVPFPHDGVGGGVFLDIETENQSGFLDFLLHTNLIYKNYAVSRGGGVYTVTAVPDSGFPATPLRLVSNTIALNGVTPPMGVDGLGTGLYSAVKQLPSPPCDPVTTGYATAVEGHNNLLHDNDLVGTLERDWFVECGTAGASGLTLQLFDHALLPDLLRSTPPCSSATVGENLFTFGSNLDQDNNVFVLDAHLRPSSAAIDNGDNNNVASTFDIDDEPRLLSGTTGMPGINPDVDIGADEYTPRAYLRRGDANADNMVSVADPIFILSYLFSSGPPPACEDAADTNDDGAMQINDPIFLLAYLFSSGPAPPTPGPDICGFDMTLDSLNRCSYVCSP